MTDSSSSGKLQLKEHSDEFSGGFRRALIDETRLEEMSRGRTGTVKEGAYHGQNASVLFEPLHSGLRYRDQLRLFEFACLERHSEN